MLTMDAGPAPKCRAAVPVWPPTARGCALMPGQNGSMALNPRCEAVHTQLCNATLAAMRLRLKSGRRDLAGQMKVTGVNDFSCPAAPFDAVMAER